jgi:hypothetical protein
MVDRNGDDDGLGQHGSTARPAPRYGHPKGIRMQPARDDGLGNLAALCSESTSSISG